MALGTAVAHAAPPEWKLPAVAEEVFLTTPAPERRGQGRILFRPDPGVYGALSRAGSARVLDFPLPDGAWVDLEILASPLVHQGTRFLVRDENGLQEVPPPEMRLYRGRVAGDPDSLVSLNLFEGQMAGFVRTEGKEFTFGPEASAAGSQEGAPAIEVRDDALEPRPSGGCDVEGGSLDAPVQGSAFGFESLSAIDGDTLLLAHVAVEGTVAWVNKHGGVSGAQAYTLNLLAQVSAIYENDLKVQLQVPFMLMNAAEPDGYSNETNSTSTVLGELRSKWNGTESLRNVFRSTVHVFGTRPSGGAGIAYVNVLCRGVPPNDNSYDFGVSLLSGNGGSWERGLVAHELGHNFSSPHSHCYSPELDQCYNEEPDCYGGSEVASVGTIMSYCSSSVDTFHQRAIDEKLRPAAEAAYPTCMDVAGMPGSVALQTGSALELEPAAICGPEALANDDGGGNGAYGYNGNTLAVWAKRFTPSCYPFKLTDVEVRTSNSSVAPGRPIRILIYTDPSGSGDPANATLVHSQDAGLQAVSSSQWNAYTLSQPVTLSAGDLYIGFQDLEADSGTNYIMDYDNSTNGDSHWQGNGTGPEGFGPFAQGTWLIRASGGGVQGGSLALSWGPPCNDAEVPNQDYGVYQGTLDDWSNLTNVTCTTGLSRSFLLETNEENVFWLVVPQNSANEGSYGLSSSGERAPAVIPCKPQAIGACQ
jgi:hypothetical protein